MRGYKEKGNIKIPLELAMLNETSRFNLVIDVVDRVPKLRSKAAHLKEEMKNAIIDNMNYAHEHGIDRPEIVDWSWPYLKGGIRPARGANAQASGIPAAIRSAPLIRAPSRPIGAGVSNATNTVSAAMTITFITPPANSSNISAQQQPTQ